MPRKKSPDARDNVMSARFSDAEASEVDAVRGGTDRSVFVHDAVMTAARREQDSRIPEPSGRNEVPVVKSGRKSRVAVAVPEPEESAPKPDRKPRASPTVDRAAKGPCEHRVKPGSYCRRCKRMI